MADKKQDAVEVDNLKDTRKRIDERKRAEPEATKREGLERAKREGRLNRTRAIEPELEPERPRYLVVP